MVTIGSPRGRSAVVAALAVLAFAGSACSSGSDDNSSDVTTSASLTSETAAPTDTLVSDTTVSDDAGDGGGEGADEGDGAAICGGITAAEVGAAVGAGDFDSADDISVDGDTTCLYTNSTSFYGVSISTEPIDTYLSGELDGLTPDEALAQLELLFTATMADGSTVARVPLGDGEALVVTGTDSILGAGKGFGGAVVDGRVLVIDTDGSELSPDAAGFAPIVSNLLALAAASS